MFETSLGVGLGLGLLAVLGAGIVLLLRNQQGQMKDSVSLLQKGMESLERNLTQHQRDFERHQEEKSALLRGEISKQLQSNRMELQQGLQQTTSSLEKRVQGMDEKVDGRLKEMSQGVQTKLEANIKEGFLHFNKVQEHLKSAGLQLQQLNNVGQSVEELNNLLKLPHLRGGFGEATLERLLTDMLPRHAYETQYGIVPGSSERVDAVIKYPKQVLPVDSKFPREQVLPLFETQDPSKLEEARKTLADVIKGQAKSIADKYIHPEHGTTDMALLFVPSETLYFEILRDQKLCAQLAKLKVFAVSPNTLSVTLHSISIAREYYEMAKGVEKTISEVKKAQKHYDNFDKRFQEVGKGIKRAQDAFDTAHTHLGRYDSAIGRLASSQEAAPKKKEPTPRLDNPSGESVQDSLL